MGWQKSAEAIVVHCIAGNRLLAGEGPNLLRTLVRVHSMFDPDAEAKAEMPERPGKAGDGIAEDTGAARQADAACDEHTKDRIPVTLEKVLSRENLWRAYERVVSNQGAPGVDGMTVEALKPFLQLRWQAIRKELLEGSYRPSPVRKVEIPKPDGGIRTLNILLDELDKELERRGHRFVRYADDCNIYVRSRRGGERVLASIERFLQDRLRLKVNRDKSAVDRPWNRKFLGYTFTTHFQPKLKVAVQSVMRFKSRLRELFRVGRGRRLARLIEELRPKLIGWVSYFRKSEVRIVFEELDQWLRRKLRVILWRQWKRPTTRARELMRRGLAPERAWASANNGRGPWWNAGASHMNQAVPARTLSQRGLPSLMQELQRLAKST